MMELSVCRIGSGKCTFWGLLSTQNFEDVEAGALFPAFFFLVRVETLSFLGQAIGIGCSLLDGLLAFRTIDAGLDELAAAAARISNFAAHGKLGTELEVQIRKKTFAGVVVKKRFYDKHYKK